MATEVMLAPSQAIKSFNTHERELYEALRTQITDKIKQDLWWHWELGHKVGDALRAARENKALYGAEFVKRLSAALGFRSETIIRGCIRLADVWPTRKAMQPVVDLTGPSGNRLSWSHVVYLTMVTDDTARMALAKTALAECWTPEMLHNTIKEAMADRPVGRGGRPHRLPSSALGCLMHITSISEKTSNLFDKAWFGERFDLAQQLHELPPDRATPELLKAVSSARANLEALKDRTEKALDAMSDAESELRTRIDDGAVDEEEESDDADCVPLRRPTPPKGKKRGKGGKATKARK